MHRVLKRLVDVHSGETRALLWSFAYFFCLLSSYYILRPLRDEMGVAGGTRNLPWMFTATFAALLLTAPLLAAAVARLPRRKFIPVVYQFFVLNIAIFWVLLKLDVAAVIVARAFFVWVTIFSVFTVSVFWSFMADLYRSEQSKRLFGFIAAGGSLGTLLGPTLTRQLAEPLGPVNLLIITAVFLELAVLCAARLEKAVPSAHLDLTAPGEEAAAAGMPTATARSASDVRAAPRTPAAADQRPVGGGLFDGFGLLFRSRYLGGIALWVFLLSLAGTFLYLQQAELVRAASNDPAQRLRIFANIELAVALLTIAVQFLATGRIIARFGTGPAAAFLPLVFAVGFVALAVHPVLLVVAVFQAAQRAANFGIANPARESLFTVVTREEKFKTKNIIDGAVFRGADALNGWLFAALRSAGLQLSTIALSVVPIAVGWLILSLALGRGQERRARDSNSALGAAA
jgi:AAA family ATP:ADP antiporter